MSQVLSCPLFIKSKYKRSGNSSAGIVHAVICAWTQRPEIAQLNFNTFMTLTLRTLSECQKLGCRSKDSLHKHQKITYSCSANVSGDVQHDPAGSVVHCNRKDHYHMTVQMISHPSNPRPDSGVPGGGFDPSKAHSVIPSPSPSVLVKETSTYKEIASSSTPPELKVTCL